MPGNAVAALHGAVLDEGRLQRMQMLGIAQPLDGDDRAAAALLGEQDAGIHRLAVEQHGADAAFGLEAVLLGAGHAELAAQHVQQRPVRLDHELVALAVDREIERLPASWAGLPDAIGARRERPLDQRRRPGACGSAPRRGRRRSASPVSAASRPASRNAAAPCASTSASASGTRTVREAAAPMAIRALPPCTRWAATQITEISIALRRPALRNQVALACWRLGEAHGGRGSRRADGRCGRAPPGTGRAAGSALPARAAQFDRGIERQQHRHEVGRRRGIDDVAADGGDVADLPAADHRGSLRRAR